MNNGYAWDDAPDWAKYVGKVGGGEYLIWYNDEQYKYVYNDEEDIHYGTFNWREGWGYDEVVMVEKRPQKKEPVIITLDNYAVYKTKVYDGVGNLINNVISVTLYDDEIEIEAHVKNDKGKYIQDGYGNLVTYCANIRGGKVIVDTGGELR